MNERVPFQIEFPLVTNATRLYEYISTDYGLSKWFANDVKLDEKNNVFTCEWDDLTLNLELVKKKKNKSIRFYIQENGNKKQYFELLIEKNMITDDLALIINDFVLPEEKEDFNLLWRAQLNNLKEEIEMEQDSGNESSLDVEDQSNY